MSKIVTVNGTDYILAEQGTEEPWGADESELIEAIVDGLNALSGSSDILPATGTISNNISSATNISGLQFNIATVLSATINYTIRRTNSTEDLVERGEILLTYRPSLNEFDLAQKYGGDNSGVTFSITSAGQVQYVSTNMSATSYEGSIEFSARVTTQ